MSLAPWQGDKHDKFPQGVFHDVCQTRPDAVVDSGIHLDTTQYPAWANHPCASAAVTASSASAIACSNASSVRAALARKSALTFDQYSSIGEKSAEYGGREETDPSGGTGGSHARELMGFEVIQTRPELWHSHLPQKG